MISELDHVNWKQQRSNTCTYIWHIEKLFLNCQCELRCFFICFMTTCIVCHVFSVLLWWCLKCPVDDRSTHASDRHEPLRLNKRGPDSFVQMSQEFLAFLFSLCLFWNSPINYRQLSRQLSTLFGKDIVKQEVSYSSVLSPAQCTAPQ